MKKEIFKIGLIFIVTVVAVVFGLYFLYGGGASKSSEASGETMTLSFDPATVTTSAMGPTQLVTVTLRIKPSVNTVLRGYSLNIPFEKDKLDIKSIDYKIGGVSTGLGDTTANIATVNQRGTIKLVGEVGSATGATLPTANPTDLVTLKFVVPDNKMTTISIEDQMVNFFAIRSNATLFNIPLAATAKLKVNGGGPTVTGGQTGNAKLKLKLKFQGIAGKPADTYNKLTVKVKLLNEANENMTDYKSADFVADASGIWSGEVSFNINQSSRYVIYVKGPYHIQKKICDEKPTETSPGTYRCDKGKITLNTGDNSLDFSGIVLLAGDLPVQDGSVTAYDTSLVRNNLGKTDADAVSKADVNRDGKVDTQDYSLIISALSVRNDE